MSFERRLQSLIRNASDEPGVSSLVVFGSTTTDAQHRRDQYSDIDFNLFVTPDEAGEDARSSWPFLPDPDALVATAREGGDGGLALYDDGLVMEFGAGRPWGISDPDREVLVDGGDIVVSDPPAPPDPANQIRVFLIKLLIGYGRTQRGEVVAGQVHLHNYALSALADALRGRLAPDAPRNPYDPLRRLEQSLPEVAEQLARLQREQPHACALGLLDLAEERLAPGWDDFPTEAFAVARRALDQPSA